MVSGMVMSLSRIQIVFPELNRTVEADPGDNLLAIMREHRIPIKADCGGVGRCGLCKVIIDKTSRLACMTHVLNDAEVFLPSTQADEDYQILVDYQDIEVSPEQLNPVPDKAGDSCAYAIAVDLGTTTVVGKLIDIRTGLEIDSFAQLNSQRAFGADVISRINIAQEDASELSGLITSQLDTLIASLLKKHHIGKERIQKLVLAGNTVMSYLLLNLPCSSLGASPFKPEFKIKETYSWEEVFRTQTLNCNCFILPFFSAFVGGDLAAGLCSLRAEDDFILLDMGTNGEILFKRKERLLCTATAVGPAFEGGSIECGSGSVRGAISAVRYEDGEFRYRTIGAAPANSICGSGILDLMAVLLQQGFIDSTGLMTIKPPDGRIVISREDGKLDCGEPGGGEPGGGESGGGESGGGESGGKTGTASVFFTQKDIRQFQLAKGAIRTGIEIICEEMGGDPPKRIYLAGGFGQNLDPQSAIVTGLLPERFHDRIFAIGNSSLNGVVKICLNESIQNSIADLTKTGHEINLAVHHHFNDLFMEHMSFERISAKLEV